ncbi:phage tail sheath family protein [Leifsonia sp. Leaf264]|uniref:phage tail sheath family protein n=1 Tax=Leifsonia sp. Leaf264 TaxID=1736314 RepID=UPI0006FF7848|nr:phage tail sheath subtilisin-like domain-containing protein [Leifsonia sp. Leaf264]KQO96744.1 phage tail protein [Leifsonia sp. Leaf264]
MPTYLSPGVYVQEIDAATRPIEGVGTAVAAFIGLAPKGPENSPTLVSNWTQYVDLFGDLYPGSYLAYAVYGYFLNGGGNCFIVRIGTAAASAKGNKREPKAVAAAQTVTIGNYVITAKNANATKPIKVEIDDAGGESPADDQFKIVIIADGRSPEVWDNVSAKSGSPDYVVTKLLAESKIVTVEEVDPANSPSKPSKGTFDLVVPEPELQPLALENLSAANYIGDASDRTGFSGLEEVDEVTMVAVPDLLGAYEQGAIDLETVKAVQLAIIAHCELMGDRMAILDPPPSLNAQEMVNWTKNVAGYDSKFATVYYPWIKVLDPASGTNRFVPPSGHIAGIWARSDNERGVHKAPANEVIRGAVELQTRLTRTEQELLNPIGANALMSFPGRGVRVWGARTLSSDPAWRYVNIRRYFNYLEKSILNATQFAVFEPNDQALWGKLRRSISAFLVGEWRQGALFGRTPDEAYFVKCDEETNPADVIDAGQVVCQIGIAPVKPAEFVIFQLSQFSGGVSAVTE